ncbi:MAG: hypothetical protein H6680_09260 [Desulfobacteraceae bacterium]|nr:hypothetical protein [Desulfobacteraceae bacterium]
MSIIFGVLIICGIAYFVFFSKRKKAEELEEREDFEDKIDASYECKICDDNNCYCEKIDDEKD